MDINELKEYIKECVANGDPKTVIYHKLEKDGISFELARDLVDRFYDEFSGKTKKKKLRKIKGVKKNYFKTFVNWIKHFEFDAIKSINVEKKYLVLVGSIITGILWGNTNLRGDFFNVVFAILIAGSMFYITEGEKNIKNQVLSLLSAIVCIFIARYLFYYEELQLRIIELNNMGIEDARLVAKSLFSLDVFKDFANQHFKVTFSTLWYIIALLVSFEFSHGDIEKVRTKFKRS
ncbi:MAG: hypothetical protein N4A47_05105 [Clostridia bacterium]|jgi:hypothetical protein|nr:hypothetical protein [Clostridia bacterium]